MKTDNQAKLTVAAGITRDMLIASDLTGRTPVALAQAYDVLFMHVLASLMYDEADDADDETYEVVAILPTHDDRGGAEKPKRKRRTKAEMAAAREGVVFAVDTEDPAMNPPLDYDGSSEEEPDADDSGIQVTARRGKL